MSDARAIEAVTQALVDLVTAGVRTVVPGATAIARPPHEIDATTGDAKVNVFLYQTEIDGSLRNLDPVGVTPGERAEPALPLVLRYLLTPYPPGPDDPQAHLLLGGALQALHSHPLLTRADFLHSDSDVSQQVESIRITWQPFDEKDIYSLWTVFQAPYRVSTAFEVRAVLIDDLRPPRTPLPVLQRGRDDRGPAVGADPRDPTPRVDGVTYPGQNPAARPGDEIVLTGENLGAATAVRFAHALLGAPVEVAVPSSAVRPDAVRVAVPGVLPAGLSSVLVLIGAPPDAVETGNVYLAVAPAIVSPMPMTVARDGAGTATVRLRCGPAVLAGQRVSLLVGDRSVPAQAGGGAVAGDSLTFVLRDAQPGSWRLRLRVDGVDSLLVADRSVVPPQFDPTQLLTVT